MGGAEKWRRKQRYILQTSISINASLTEICAFSKHSPRPPYIPEVVGARGTPAQANWVWEIGKRNQEAAWPLSVIIHGRTQNSKSQSILWHTRALIVGTGEKSVQETPRCSCLHMSHQNVKKMDRGSTPRGNGKEIIEQRVGDGRNPQLEVKR